MRTVLCHGVFDILHAGHLAYFKGAKKYGDRLIVSVTTDEFVKKGPGRPYFNTERRAEMLRSLAIIDEVAISDEPTAIGAIQKFQPHFYVKGPDYKDFSKDVTGEIINEKREVELHGGKLVFTDEETFSSSNIINRFFQGWEEAQKEQIEKINSLGGIGACEAAINEISKLKILIIGEPILDVYRFVQPEGISSKSPSISARFLYEESYRGGSMAIHTHLLGFSEEVSLLPGPMQTKIRYISGKQRVFEVTEIKEDINNREFLADKFLEKADDVDVVIIADFGHGMFEGELLDACSAIHAPYVGLNVQTNSSNYGFNVFSKHKKYDYLCLDTREARLAKHDRYSGAIDIGRTIHSGINANMSLTLGSNGSILFTKDNEFKSPAFSDVIIDATGAGDAYFAITTCLLASGCNPEIVPFIGNVFAGLKTKIIGNKSAVSKASLLKAIKGILA